MLAVLIYHRVCRWISQQVAGSVVLVFDVVVLLLLLQIALLLLLLLLLHEVLLLLLLGLLLLTLLLEVSQCVLVMLRLAVVRVDCVKTLEAGVHMVSWFISLLYMFSIVIALELIIKYRAIEETDWRARTKSWKLLLVVVVVEVLSLLTRCKTSHKIATRLIILSRCNRSIMSDNGVFESLISVDIRMEIMSADRVRASLLLSSA